MGIDDGRRSSVFAASGAPATRWPGLVQDQPSLCRGHSSFQPRRGLSSHYDQSTLPVFTNIHLLLPILTVSSAFSSTLCPSIDIRDLTFLRVSSVSVPHLPSARHPITQPCSTTRFAKARQLARFTANLTLPPPFHIAHNRTQEITIARIISG